MLLLPRRPGRRALPGTVLALVVTFLLGPRLPAQVPQDQQARMLLDSARRAYNEKNYPFAVGRFREFLGKFGGHKEAPSAHYGLALCLIEGPDHDYNGAVEQLQPLLGNQALPDRPFILYHFALAKRGQGIRELAETLAKPQEAPQRRNNASQRFAEAVPQFAAAAAAFQARAKQPGPDARELPIDLEWAARARCDEAEMLLRTLKFKEAQTTAAPFLEAPLTKSRYHGLGLYYHGFASFMLGDHMAAGRSLNQLAPFSDPVYGTHARYLVARVHQQVGERAEASRDYQGLLADYAKQKQDAPQALQHPEKFRNDPEEKARLEALVKGPPPEYVARATFYLGTLLYEDGRFADALTHFTNFVQQHPADPLHADAQLRQGFCQVQLKQYGEALKTLQPVADKEPRLADQALLWIGKAQAGAADPNNPAAHDQALRTAVDTLRRAADRAGQFAGSDPGAKERRAEILLEVADTQQEAKQYREAAATYNQLLNEKALPRRSEEILERQIAALHLAGDYAGSDALCARFEKEHPKSTLLPAVLFRHAENAYFQAVALDKNPNAPNRGQELARANDEIIKRYQAVVDRFPEFAYVNLARHGMAMGYYRKGDLDKAREILEKIPATDRTGALAAVPYALADILIRQAPAKADDALAAGKLEEQLRGAAELLEGFVNAQPNGPQTPDALLKLGACYQRIGAILIQPPDKAKALGSARAAYERLMQQFPKHELEPRAILERAKCMAQAGDANGAINELRRFNNDPLKTARVAPLAVLELATLLRGQNKAVEAADELARWRQQHEGELQRDPTRAHLVTLLQYHQGVALREAGKRPEARAILDQVVRTAAGRPEGFEAALRFGQCLKEEGEQKIDAARKKLVTPNLPPDQTAAANRDRDAGLADLRNAGQFLENQAAQLKQKQADAEARARMLYEAAWCTRELADAEVAAARDKIAQERWQKAKDEAAKKAPPGVPPVVARPEVPLKDVPVQPAEQKARALYQALLTDFPDLPLAAGDAHLELAELLAGRGDNDGAIKLLREALDKEPSPEMTDKICMRLGACLFDKGDPKEGLAQFLRVAENPKSPLAAQAHYRAGEALLAAGDCAEAIKHLAVFRDRGEFQNIPGLTDRALLRLGHAYAQLKQWEPSRQAHEQVVNRFGNGPWGNEARYGIGWAWQNLKQYDNAVGAYSQVVANTGTELGAKAQLQIGLCRLEQKRLPEATTALLVVPYTYDYPELSAAALVEAARAFAEQKQPEQAARLLRRVIKDHPASPWGKVAQERLGALEGR
ncbi:MAG TPA: tetratricopeptide repeat protein [Gemmataceae bacterium]|nr:tetratricopeptide repeat protein [Gemmataceae bacterium]